VKQRFSSVLGIIAHAAAFAVALLLPSLLFAQAKQVAETSRQLQAIKVVDSSEEDMPYDVPASVQPLVQRFKHELRDLIADTLSAQGPSATPRSLRDFVIRALSQENVKLMPVTAGPNPNPPSADLDRYGLIEDISVERPTEAPNLIAVVTTLHIPCGADSSVYIFEQKDNRWILALADESKPYPQVNGAREGFEYSIVPLSHASRWYLAESWDSPWCTSAWGSLHYKVVEPGRAAYEPHVILAGDAGCNRTYPVRLKATATTFQLVFVTWQRLDADLWARNRIVTYDVTKTPPVRVPPLGTKPEDFLDEWVNLPWAEAARWIEANNSTKTAQGWHAALAAATHDELARPEIDFSQPCEKAESATAWQIGLSIPVEKGAPKVSNLLYVSIRRRGTDDFVITGITTVRPPGCPGETRPLADDLPTE